MLRIALLLTAGALYAQNSMQWTREGPYYVLTTSAAVPGRVTAQLHIGTHGNVVLRGTAGEQILYKLVRRVRAHSEAEASRMLGSGAITNAPRSGVTTLTVTVPAGARVSNDLEVSVPRAVLLSSVVTPEGSVAAYDLDGSVQIDASMGIRCDRIRGSVNGQTAGGEIRLGRIGGSAVCISGGGLIFIESVGGGARCETAGGEIVVKEAGGPLLLANRSGNIEVDHAARTVEAHTGEGVISVNRAGGEVIADTRGGSIQIGSAHGARCESAAGAVRVKNESGPLNVRTEMGNILAELIAGERLADSLLSARSGDITVLIPSKLGLSVMAINDSGSNVSIQSDFPEVHAKAVDFGHPPTVAQGQINGGGPLLRIRVAAGIIYLKKLKQ